MKLFFSDDADLTTQEPFDYFEENDDDSDELEHASDKSAE